MYAKVFDSIYSGSLRGKPYSQLVFIYLLVNSWQTKGICDIHPSRIVDDTGLSLDQVEAALCDLQRPDPESRSPKLSGSRIALLDEHRAWGWRIVNWDKYNAVQKSVERKEYQANYFQSVLKYRRAESRKVSVSTEERRGEESKGEKDSKSLSLRTPFKAPTTTDVSKYCYEKGLSIDAEQFCGFYQSKGWRVGNQPMKDWKAAVMTWARRRAIDGKAQSKAKMVMEFGEKLKREEAQRGSR